MVRTGSGWSLVLLALATGCTPTEPLEVGPNQLISAGDLLGASDRSLERWQSEQSAVRAIDARNGAPIIVVGFNDGGGTLDGFGNPVPPGTQNKMGYAFLRDGETQWTYGRVPLGAGMTTITAANGDPWLATNVTRDRIYYAGLGISQFTVDQGPDTVLVAVHDEVGAPSFWRPAFAETGTITNQGSVSAIPTGSGTDKPSIAVSPDATEDVYLAWSCPQPICSVADRQVVHFMRVDGSDGSIHQTSISSGGLLVQNPIVATDPREPDSVFVAFQILTSDVPTRWDVRVVKSIDRGDSFPLGPGGRLNGDPVTPADDLRPARGPTIRNGIFVDYFAAEDGWHYLVFEDEGLVYFTRAQPIDPVPDFPPLDGVAWVEPVRVSIPDSPSLGVRNFQPAVAGLGARVIVTYYEQSLTGNDASTYVVARVSEDQGDTWRTTTVSRDEVGDTLMFEPCTLQNRIDESYFGDYIDVQPLSLPTLPDTGFFVTWTDSRVPSGETGDSCSESSFTNAVHHHTYGATVR